MQGSAGRGWRRLAFGESPADSGRILHVQGEGWRVRKTIDPRSTSPIYSSAEGNVTLYGEDEWGGPEALHATLGSWQLPASCVCPGGASNTAE